MLKAYNTRALWVALGANLSIFAIKAVSALISNSAAMFSEALHSLADLVNSIFLLIGIRLAIRPADEEHPFGYGKEVYFWSFVASIFMLGVTSMGSLLKGYGQIKDPHPLEHFSLTIAALVIATCIEAIAVHSAMQGVLREAGHNAHGLKLIPESFQVLEKVANPAIKLVFFEDLVAFFGVVLALAAIVAVKLTNYLILDGLVSILIGVTLSILAITLAYENRELIIGRAATDSLEQLIGDIALNTPRVKDVHSLKTMYLGPKSLLVNMEIEVDPHMTVDKMDDVVADVESRIKQKIPIAHHFSIEVLADDQVPHWETHPRE